ncbi:MAG: TIGR03759 family integrating conjugative element protein [Alphaproteobacteria bacterium]|nr:TIGR03759 family integrating conjugative element protein [Alphaproteobacteria bacterium]
MPRGVLWGATVLAWLAGAVLHAAETSDSEVTESVRSESGRRAWNLTVDDWTRYEALMRGRRGVWTPGADPLLVLGAHARTEAERRRFAEAFVLAEHARVEGELAFERAVQAAWTRLFPGQLRIAGAASSGAAPADRYALVVDRDCAGCEPTVRTYLASGLPLDLYVRGAADDADLRAWATAHGVDPSRVRGGTVTVNHGDASVSGKAPAVWARRAGRWAAVE